MKFLKINLLFALGFISPCFAMSSDQSKRTSHIVLSTSHMQQNNSYGRSPLSYPFPLSRSGFDKTENLQTKSYKSSNTPLRLVQTQVLQAKQEFYHRLYDKVAEQLQPLKQHIVPVSVATHKDLSFNVQGLIKTFDDRLHDLHNKHNIALHDVATLRNEIYEKQASLSLFDPRCTTPELLLSPENQEIFYDKTTKVLKIEAEIIQLHEVKSSTIEYAKQLDAIQIYDLQNTNLKTLVAQKVTLEKSLDIYRNKLIELKQRFEICMQRMSDFYGSFGGKIQAYCKSLIDGNTQQNATTELTTIRQNIIICENTIEHGEHALAKLNAFIDCANYVIHQRLTCEHQQLVDLQKTITDPKALHLRDEPLLAAIQKTYDEKDAHIHTLFETLTPQAKELVIDICGSVDIFNDLHGNAVGKYLCSEVAEILNHCAQQSDKEASRGPVVVMVQAAAQTAYALKHNDIEKAVMYRHLVKINNILYHAIKGGSSGLAANVTNAAFIALVPGYKQVQGIKLALTLAQAARNNPDFTKALTETCTHIYNLPIEQQVEFGMCLLANLVGPNPDPVQICRNFFNGNAEVQGALSTLRLTVSCTNNLLAKTRSPFVRVIGQMVDKTSIVFKRTALAGQLWYKVESSDLVSVFGVTFNRNLVPQLEKMFHAGSVYPAASLIRYLKEMGAGYSQAPKTQVQAVGDRFGFSHKQANKSLIKINPNVHIRDAAYKEAMDKAELFRQLGLNPVAKASIKHIFNKHYPGGVLAKPGDACIFIEGTNIIDLMLESWKKGIPLANDSSVKIYDTQRIIGMVEGVPTTKVRIALNETLDGIKTMYPTL